MGYISEVTNFDKSMERTLNNSRGFETLKYTSSDLECTTTLELKNKDEYETATMNKNKSLTMLRKEKSNLEDQIKGMNTQ